MQTESGLRTEVLVLLVAMKARESYMLPWSHVASFNCHRRGHNESPWVVSWGFMEPWIELKHQEARIVCWNGSNDDWHSKLRYNTSGAARGVHMFTCKVYSGLLDLFLLELGRCMSDMSNCYISLQLPFQRPRNRTPCFSKWGHFLERRPPAESASAKVHSCLKLDAIPSCCRLRYVRCCYQVKRISLTDYDSLRRCEVAKAWNDFQATLNTRRTFDSIDTTTCPQGWRASQNGVPIVGMQANRSQSLQWFQQQYLTVKFSKFIIVAFVLD